MRATFADLLGVETADLPGLRWSCSASLTLMGGYYFIQPLSDTMALRAGIEFTPFVSTASLALLVICNPLYALLVASLPLSAVQPVLHRFLSACLLFFAIMFLRIPSIGLSFAFTIFLGAFAPFLMSTFWVRMAHIHTQREAHRVYGAVSAAAQFGELLASVAAAPLFGFLSENILILSAVSVECSVRFIRLRALIGEGTPAQLSSPDASLSTPSKEMKMESSPVPASTATAKQPPTPASTHTRAAETALDDEPGDETSMADQILRGPRLLFSTPLLRTVTLHTLLLSFLVSGVWYERADLTVTVFASTEARVGFFSTLNAIVGGITMVVQLFFFSRVTSAAFGPTWTLLAEPLVLTTGLVAALLLPTSLTAVAYLDCSRKIAHYALSKPTKESLYTALPYGVSYRAKPLLDTFVNRTGSLLGAGFFGLCMRLQVAPTMRRTMLLFVTLVWMVVSWDMGKLSAPSPAPSTTPGVAVTAASISGSADNAGPSVDVAPSPPARRDRPFGPWILRWCQRGNVGAVLWLAIFCATGIAIGMSFEVLQLHAGPAEDLTFLLAFFGFWAQLLVSSLAVLLTGSWRRVSWSSAGIGDLAHTDALSASSSSAHSGDGSRARWTRGAVLALLGSSFLNCAAHAADYVAQVEGGYQLFTILHSSVTLFAALLAVVVLKAEITPLQCIGVGCVFFGLLATSLPQPLPARKSLLGSGIAALAGSFCVALSYVLSELTFRLTRSQMPVTIVAVFGSLVGVVIYTTWTLCYTLPRWDVLVVAPIYTAAEPSVTWALVGYASHAVLVGIHTLAFFESINCLGTVPVAVSKGAQQAGSFIFAHVFFCSHDVHECFYPPGATSLPHGASATAEQHLLDLWLRWQKRVAFILCCVGVGIYATKAAIPEREESSKRVSDAKGRAAELM